MIETRTSNGVTVLTLTRPPVNALDLELLDALISALGAAGGPVVITGSGRCFSAGVDLQAVLDGGPEYTNRFLRSLVDAFLAVFDHPAPVVAAVNGHAIAGGCVIAMAADVRLMAAGTIGISEVVVGVPFPVAALEICRYAMGSSVSAAALGGQSVSPETALARGWVSEVVAPDELLERAIAAARALAQHSATAYAFTKEQLHRPARTAVAAAGDHEEAVRQAWVSDDTRTRMQGFLEALRR